MKSDVFDGVLDIERSCFDRPLDASALERAVFGRRRPTLFVATVDRDVVGYKAGFELDHRTYMSFLGGVLPGHRRRGIATALMSAQHAWANGAGYTGVRTHTKNKYRDMLVLNLRAGFDVIGTIQKPGERHLTIVLEKSLSRAV